MNDREPSCPSDRVGEQVFDPSNDWTGKAAYQVGPNERKVERLLTVALVIIKLNK